MFLASLVLSLEISTSNLLALASYAPQKIKVTVPYLPRSDHYVLSTSSTNKDPQDRSMVISS